ncbi:MAG: outer membrane lipoprotein-sorting protein [Bacteroidota bacterium]
MKKLWITCTLSLITFGMSLQAQTVEEILTNYFENTGGLENWQQLEGIHGYGKGRQGGQEFPGQMVQLKNGKQMQKYSVQGKEFFQGVFDGETLWSTNFLNMKAEKSSSEETANFKLEANDFPDSFLNWKEKGYTVELMGTESMEGTDTYKIKLVKEPVTVDGEQVDDISFYYFDTENYVPIAMETEIKSGPAKGKTVKVVMSDYQEVDGLYFAFSTTQYLGEQPMLSIQMDSLQLNPKVDDSLFAFPETITEGDEK